MSLQARLKSNTPLYNANRDVAHCFPGVVSEVARRLDGQVWPELHKALPTLSEEELGKAAVAFVTFVAAATERPTTSMYQELERTGWFDIQPEAQIAYMATLGSLLSGLFFAGAREATLGGEGPCMGLEALVVEAKESARLLSMPRYKRKVHAAKRRISGVITALFGSRVS